MSTGKRFHFVSMGLFSPPGEYAMSKRELPEPSRMKEAFQLCYAHALSQQTEADTKTNRLFFDTEDSLSHKFYGLPGRE